MGLENTQGIDYCVAIIGIPNQNVLNNLLSDNTHSVKIHNVSFVEARSRFEWTSWLTDFGPNLLGIGAGSAGCLLAHRDAWATIESCEHDLLLVLEDDAVLTKYGKKYFSDIVHRFRHSDLQLLHLGDHIHYSVGYLAKLLVTLNIRELMRASYESFVLKAFKPKLSNNRFPFSGHAYLLNTEMARVLLSMPVNFLYPVDVHLNAISQVSKNKVAKIRTPMFIQANKRVSQIKERGR